MKTKCVLIILILDLLPFSLIAQTGSLTQNCVPCEQLKSIQLPDIAILDAKETPEGHCRILGRIGKEINFELLLPKNWNKRFVMGGGGGFVGSITNLASSYVNSGFATSGTDTGHKGSGMQARWALNNMERQLNFGQLAIHRTATVSKAIINAYYCSYPIYSYFIGASRGGGQGMLEAQLYPEDFNGIVIACPAIGWPAFAAKFIQIAQKIYPDPKNLNNHVITQDNLWLLQHHVLKQCDGIDGLVDSIISNPINCKFDLSGLPVCPDNKIRSDCFTKQQLDAIKTICEPLIIQKDTVYPGFVLGAENEINSWGSWITGSDTSLKTPSYQYLFGTETFKYLIFNDPGWDYSKYDFSNYYKDTKYASSYLDATKTDYSEFKKRDGKIIMVHGWNDPAQSVYSTINHYKAVEKNDKDLRSYMRLFLLPGVLHLYGGLGPDNADWLNLLVDWVEKNEAPERVIVSKIINNQVIMTRPVYPFPKIVKYDGQGNPKLESSFKLNEEKLF
jgi:Tannase and feruloyl esterase